MDWNKDTILSFISFIRERPVIWDTQSPDHKMKNKRHDAMVEVAMLMDVSVKEVIAKWAVLRSQFSREKKKITGMRTGSGADSVYTTKWYAYKEMEDLMSCNTPIVNIDNSEENDSSVNQTPPCTPTPPPRHSTPTPPPPQITPTPPPPQTTSTPPPLLTPIPPPKPPLPKKKKRETDGQSSVYKEAVETLKVMRERKNCSQNPADDDLTSFGLYIAAHLRKYSLHLQCKAKYEINNILYKLDMESLRPYSPVETSVSSIDDSDSPLSPRFSTIDDQCKKKNYKNSITHTSDTLTKTDISQETAENEVIFLSDQYISEAYRCESPAAHTYRNNETEQAIIAQTVENEVIVLSDHYISETYGCESPATQTYENNETEQTAENQVIILSEVISEASDTETKQAVKYLLTYAPK